MHRRSFVLVLGACAGLLALPRAVAQAVAQPDTAIRELLRRRIDVDKRATGMVVGIVADGQRRVVAYGTQAAGDVRPVAADTLFEIGSLTKVFTALLLADAIQRKQLQFDDPVDRYLPADWRLPQHDGRAITLADLATHTAGLPLFPPLTGHPLEAIARYGAADLQAWLGGLTLSRAPGSQWAYSNVGYALLGLALANQAKASYEALLDRRILDPLGLRDTTLRPAGAALDRLAAGHSPALAPVPPLDLGLFAPAGALRSTVWDLLGFIEAVLPDSGSPLEAPAQRLLAIRRPAPPIDGDQALGWEVAGGAEPYLVKDGVTAGQAASIVLDVPRRLGVVVLSNALPVKMKAPPDGGVGAADLARHLVRPTLPVG